MADPDRPAARNVRALLLALVLACATLITLDHQAEQSSPDGPLGVARRAVGEVFGPVESATATVLGPVTAIPEWFQGQESLRRELADAKADNDVLRQQAESMASDRKRLAEYDGLVATAKDTGRALVPAHVVAMGPGQSFSRTITIDAGSDAGVHPDMTVVNNAGLVGRVLRVTRTTATVLTVVDGDSVVGARVGSTREAGYLRGRGVIGDDGRLDLELVDESVAPDQGEAVVTWGSRDGSPYVAGIPIGAVTQVFESLRETSKRAVVEPYVDFSALDAVGVIVPSGTRSDRHVIEADGSMQ